MNRAINTVGSDKELAEQVRKRTAVERTVQRQVAENIDEEAAFAKKEVGTQNAAAINAGRFSRPDLQATEAAQQVDNLTKHDALESKVEADALAANGDFDLEQIINGDKAAHDCPWCNTKGEAVAAVDISSQTETGGDNEFLPAYEPPQELEINDTEIG